MLKRMSAVFLFVIVVSIINSTAFGFTEEEQYIYNNLYLHLPWEIGKVKVLTQKNRNNCSDDGCTHKTGSVDEYALDFDFNEGDPIVSAANGMLYTYTENSTNAPAYGNHIKLDHGYFYTLYAHLSSFHPTYADCASGCEVLKGKIIGYAGGTGYSFGSHLHFGLFHGYAWNDGYSYSVQSKIVIGKEGSGPYQTLQSLQFQSGNSYMSENFKFGEEGPIVCENGVCTAQPSNDVGGVPVAGPRPDFTPDFDVYHMDGHEISVNCDNCPGEKVRSGQVVRMRLEVETHNRDVVTSDLRNSSSQSIDGKIRCRVVGKIDWYEIPGSENQLEYDVDNLVTDNNSSVEEINYTIPNYPGSTLECQATVDDDDEVIEESETNNTSRIERFFIEDFRWLIPIHKLLLGN